MKLHTEVVEVKGRNEAIKKRCAENVKSNKKIVRGSVE